MPQQQKVSLALLIIIALLNSPATSGQSINDASFIIALSEQTKTPANPPSLHLKVSTRKEYPCANFGIEHSINISNNKIEIHLGGIIEHEICMTAIGTASFSHNLSIDEGEYELILNHDNQTDTYTLSLNEKQVSLETLDASFTQIADHQGPGEYSALRTPDNLIAVTCLRYQYGCEDQLLVANELCPILFANVSEIATPVDEEQFRNKRTLGSMIPACTNRKENSECSLFEFEGPINELEKVFNEAESYQLKHGYKASCRDSKLYYKRIDTWLGQTLCC